MPDPVSRILPKWSSCITLVWTTYRRVSGAPWKPRITTMYDRVSGGRFSSGLPTLIAPFPPSLYPYRMSTRTSRRSSRRLSRQLARRQRSPNKPSKRQCRAKEQPSRILMPFTTRKTWTVAMRWRVNRSRASWTRQLPASGRSVPGGPSCKTW